MSYFKKSNSPVLRLCINAVLISLVVIFDLFSVKLGNDYKITFGGFPIILCAMLYGPVDAAIVGLSGSFLGQLFTYGISVTTPLWILPAGIRGIVMGLLFIAFKKSTKPAILTTEIVISSIAVSLANTAAMYADFLIMTVPNEPGATYPFVLVTFVIRIVNGILSALVYSAVVQAVLLVIKKYTQKENSKA